MAASAVALPSPAVSASEMSAVVIPAAGLDIGCCEIKGCMNDVVDSNVVHMV